MRPTLLPVPPPSAPILSRRSWARLALLAAAVVVTLLTRPGALVGLALLAAVLTAEGYLAHLRYPFGRRAGA